MNWFGRAFGCAYEADTPHVETPVGEPCAWCDEPIEAGDSGLLIPHLTLSQRTELRPHHYECHLRSVIGGVNHLRGRCTCCGGTEPPDPEGLSRRVAAQCAVTAWQAKPR